MRKTYHGSCHCGAVRYVAELDLSEGTQRCNCSYCRKTRNWSQRTTPEHVRILDGGDRIGWYDRTGAGVIAHGFCTNCGVRLFSRGDIPQMGGAFVSVMVPTLDDAAPEELIAAPLAWCDGLHDNWWNAPQEVRHL